MILIHVELSIRTPKTEILTVIYLQHSPHHIPHSTNHIVIF